MELFYSGDLEMENKYQEALRRIAFNYGLSALDGDTNEIMDDNFNEDMGVIKELVDKETPMKPINNKYEITLLDKILGSEQTYTCPRCRNACLETLATNKRNINRYCYDCGQKIDWTDDNE